jgi:2-methylcitrate dehydratase PrpD
MNGEGKMANQTVSSLDLAKEMIALDAAVLTEDDIAQLQRLIMDYSAVTLCGSVQPWGRKMRIWAREQKSNGPARLIGSGDLANAATAALANGTAAHGYELDDTHEASSSHPGAVVISAAFAVAAECDSNGRDILAAIAAGYEAMTRIGRAAISQQVTERGFHATCLFGPFGAATAAAKLMGLDAEGLARSWGLALSLVGGSSQFAHEPQGTMVKRMHAGIPAMHGVISAQLGKLEMSAPVNSLEGPLAFYHLYSENPNLELLTRQAGAPLEIHNVSFKPYSCCRKFHSLIDCLEIATRNFTHNPEDITKIDVYSPGNAIKKHAIRRPSSVMAAQYSMPYITAATLAYGPKKYEAFETTYHQDPTILSLIDKTKAHHDPKLDTFLPDNMANRVTVHFADGREESAEVIKALGSPKRSLSFDGVLEKAEPLVDMVDPSINLAAIADTVQRLPEMTDVDDLMQLLVTGTYDATTAMAAE